MKWIIEKANEIREKYGIDDLELLASQLGAKVVEEPLGRIIKECYIKDLEVIIIDPNLHPYKKRHLIAHGLAHHLFHKESKVNYFLEDKDNSFNNWMVKEHEKEAEVFAAYLLIPEDKLNVLMNEGWLENSSDPILELAEEFQVSKNFMRKRLILKRLFENNDKIKVNNYEIENCNN
jgi:Zn-dependent peptidase ImmA (M78 family)